MLELFKKKIEGGLEQIYQDGDVIIKEGDKGSQMYIIKSGAAKVTKKSDKGEITLATLSSGDFFGEMALFDRAPRSATVSAVGETRVIVLHAGNFLYRIRQDPTLVFEMVQKMSKRIRRLNEQLVRTLDKANLDPELRESILAEIEFFK